MKPHTVSCVTQRETTVITTQSSSSGLCMHIKLTSRLLRWHLSRHRTYFYTGTKKREYKKETPSSWIQTQDARGTATYLFTYSGSYMTIYQIDTYLYVRTDVWEKLTKKNENITRRRETTRARSGPLLAGSGGATSSNQRTERWTSSRSRAFTAQNLV